MNGAGVELDVETRNPYVGPRPFDRKEADRFFGREDEIADLASLVGAHDLLLLYAESGAGKTSLLNAGLVPALEQKPYRYRILPMVRFASCLRDQSLMDDSGNVFLRAAVRTILETEDACTDISLVDAIRARDSLEAIDQRDSLLVIDQFEELFTSHRERWEEREGFFRQLAAAIDEFPTLRVVLGMREDYLAHLDPYIYLLPGRFLNRFRLERLREESAMVAIQEPLLRHTGVRFAPEIAEKMLKELLTVEVAVPGSTVRSYKEEYVEPVQLQVVCFSCYRNLPKGQKLITEDHAAAFGNVDRALTEFYEEAVSAVTKAEQVTVSEATLRNWFDHPLITEQGTRGLVFFGATTTGGIPNAVIGELEAAHIIRRESRGKDTWYELSHDRFVKPILEANRVWNEHRNAELVRQAEALQAEARQAEARQKEEFQAQYERDKRKHKWWFWSLAALLLLFVILVYEFHKTGRAHRQDQAVASTKLKTVQSELSDADAVLSRKTAELNAAESELNAMREKKEGLKQQNDSIEKHYESLVKINQNLVQTISENRSVLGKTQAGRRVLAQVDAGQEVLAPAVVPAGRHAAVEASAGKDAEVARKAADLALQNARAAAVGRELESLKQLVSTPREVPAVHTAAVADARLEFYAGAAILPNKKRPSEIIPEIYVDGTPWAFVVPKTHFYIKLTPGPHRICVADAFSPCDEGRVTTVTLHSNAESDIWLGTDGANRNYVPSKEDPVSGAHRALAKDDFPSGQTINQRPINN